MLLVFSDSINMCVVHFWSLSIRRSKVLMILIENGVIEQGKTLLPYVSQFYHTDLSVQDRTTPSNKSHVTTNFQTYEMFCTDWTNMSKGGSFSQ